MRRRKPFNHVDGNCRDRKREIPPNDPPDSKKIGYSPTASIVEKTRHLVNDEAFDFLSSSLELKFARKHEERQKKARAEIAKARERSIKEKSSKFDKKITTTSLSRFGSQTKTPKISNCTGNESNSAETKSSNVGGPKSSNDGKPQSAPSSGAHVEVRSRKTKPNINQKKPKLATIEEEDPMQLSDLIGADQRGAFRTNQLLQESHRLEEQNSHAPTVDREKRDQCSKDPGENAAIGQNKIEVANLHDQRTTSNTPISGVVTSSFKNTDMEMPDLATRLGRDLEMRDECLDDMELVATDDESLRSSSTSSIEESCENTAEGVDETPKSSLQVLKLYSSSEAADSDNASKGYRSPMFPVVKSTAQSVPESSSLSHDVARSALSDRFWASLTMPNSTSLSKTPVASNVIRQQVGEEQRCHDAEKPRDAEKGTIVCNDPNYGSDACGQEVRVHKQTDCSADGTVDEILRALIATPPENAAAMRAMLASCKEERLLSDDLLNQGYVVEIDHAETEGSCGETSELTCDIDGRYAHQKRKKRKRISKERKRIKTQNNSIKEEEQSECASSSPPAKKAPDPYIMSQEIALQEGLPQKNAAISGHSKAEYSGDIVSPSAGTMPVIAEMKRASGVTPPTNPYLGFPTPMSFEESNEKIPRCETNDHINSPYLWTAQRAGHFNIEPIFQLVDGKFYRHPPLPPGWTISVSQSRSLPFYHHPDFGSTWYPPVALPMTEGNCAGRRMLVSAHANENMIPWSGFVNQFMKKNTQVPSSREKCTSGSLFSCAGADERESNSSSVLRSVLHRETPMLPAVSRNVAFSDHTGCNVSGGVSFHVQENQLLVLSSDGLQSNESLHSLQESDKLTARSTGKQILGEPKQKTPSSESREAVPLNGRIAGFEIDSHREDGVEQIEMVSKLASESSEGKVGLLLFNHLSPEILATSRSASQSPVSLTSSVSAGSSKRHARGILDTPAHSTISNGESRRPGSSESKRTSPQWKQDLYADFRGVGYESEEFRRKQATLSGVGLEDVSSGVVNLGRKHVCLSQEKNSACGKTDCLDVESDDRQKSTRNENGLSSRQSGADCESINSHQSHDHDFLAPDDDEQDQSSCEEFQANYSEKPDIVRREIVDPPETDVSGMGNAADGGAGNRDPWGKSQTKEVLDSPYDGDFDPYLKALKASSIFVPRVKRTFLHETKSQTDADDASVNSWRSRASSLMSSSSHRVRFPPMPICSLQSLDTCPVVKTRVSRSDRSRKTMVSAKAKKVPKKSMRKHVSKATR